MTRLVATIVLPIGIGIITMLISGSLNSALGAAIGVGIFLLLRPKILDPLLKKKPDDQS